MLDPGRETKEVQFRSTVGIEATPADWLWHSPAYMGAGTQVSNRHSMDIGRERVNMSSQWYVILKPV